MDGPKRILRWGGGIRWPLWVLGVFAAFIVGSACYGVLSNHPTIPINDHWQTLRLYEHYLNGSLSFSDFWEQQSEHRIFFPRFFYLLDYMLAHGTGYFLIGAILLLQGLHALLLGFGVWKSEGLNTGGRLFFSLLAFAFLFWIIQFENLGWSFQICWMLNGFFASAAAFIMAGTTRSGEERPRWRSILAAALCCVIATYSLANGIFISIVLSLVLWKARQRMILKGFWILFVLVLAGSYFIGYYQPTEHSSPLKALNFQTLHYLVAYLGNPVVSVFGNPSPYAASHYTPFAILWGVFGLGLFLLFFIRFLIQKRPTFYQTLGFTQVTYAVFTAVITASGRVKFGIAQAGTSRYQTAMLIFWFFVLTLAYPRVKKQATALWIQIGVLAVLFLFVLPVHLKYLYGQGSLVRQYDLNADEGALGLIVGVQDSLMPKSDYRGKRDMLIWEKNGFLKSHRLSVYSEPWTLTLGSNLSEGYRVDSNAVLAGGLMAVSPSNHPLRSGYFVRGKIDLEKKSAPPEILIFTNEGRIVGFAKTRNRPCHGCFSGYVRGLENERFEVFALEKKGSNRIEKVVLSAGS